MDGTCANPSWTVLIVYKCVSRALWASCVYTFTAFSGSVFSEAFLVLVLGEAPGRSCVYIVDFSGIARSVFLDLIAPDCHVVTTLRRALFEIFVQSTKHYFC